MKLRPAAEIDADFPDDAVVEGGDFVIFGGRGIAEALAEKFSALGYSIEPVEPEGHRGWTFVVAIEKKRVIFQATDFGRGEYLLTSYSGDFFTKADPERAKLLVQLNVELARDPRFKKVRWVVEDDINGGTPGHSDPLDDEDLPALMDKVGKPAKALPEAKSKSADGDDPPAGLLRRLLGIFGWR